jgi:hypothetical protein
MSAAPQIDGMGGLLSTLTLGLIGKKNKQPVMTQDDIVSQMALVVQQKLQAQGASADVGKIKESLGYNLNQFAAWSQVLTDANIVDQISNKVIADLLASNLVTLPPSIVNASGGQAISYSAPVNPALILGGLGLAAVLMMKGKRRGRR